MLKVKFFSLPNMQVLGGTIRSGKEMHLKLKKKQKQKQQNQDQQEKKKRQERTISLTAGMVQIVSLLWHPWYNLILVSPVKQSFL